MTITTLILESDDPVPVLIEGLTVRVFDTVGAFVTSGLTDPSGEVIVDIPDADYDLYFFKSGVSITGGMPQRITVDVADADVPPNTFKVIGHVASLPEAVDPALCRITGTLRASNGLPSQNGSLVFAPYVEAGYVMGALLSPQSYIPIRPDSAGEYDFELIRNLEYRGYFTDVDQIKGLATQPFEMRIIVPDLPALDIINLLFPLPVSATFSSPTLALIAGNPQDESMELAVLYSDGSDRTTKPAHGVQVSLLNDNEAVCSVERSGVTLVITPLAAGVANISVVRTLSLNSLIFNPTPAFVTETLEVTVT